MRVSKANNTVRVRAIAGTRVVLMALDVPDNARAGLAGFAIKCAKPGKEAVWLRGTKYFAKTVPNPKPEDDYSTREQPLQSLLWSDYGADPGTKHDFTVVPLYGAPDNLVERDPLDFSIATEKENDGRHGVWFNRGAIASHAFATKYHNKRLTDEMVNNVSDDGKLLDDEVKWLSRGLAEACLHYINDTKSGDGLRVCAYEFTYLPVLKALKRALDRGVDVQIVYHDTKKDDDANRKAIGEAKLPKTVSRGGKTVTILYPRTRTKIPHNKFIVKLAGGKPQQVWTGSTNFTDSGFYGQTNVGHLVSDATTAETYLDFWLELAGDPPLSQAVKNAMQLTPNPPAAIGKRSIAAFFSPRIGDNMLDWYAHRIGNTVQLAMMTIPFNVAPAILGGLDDDIPSLRLVILEDVPSREVIAAERKSKNRLLFSNGALMGKNFVKHAAGGATVTPIPNSDLDRWFIGEELNRPTNYGHVFFIHSKVLVIDPLSDDPLVCSGSANFSTNSLTNNDENMLLIRGDTRVADIYMTELDRLFRHFHARDVINKTAVAGDNHNPLLLDTTGKWIAANTKDGTYKNNRRLLFFPATEIPRGWADAAGEDGDVFADEVARAAAKRKRQSDAAKARKAAKGATASGGSARKKSPPPKAKPKAKPKVKAKPKAKAKPRAKPKAKPKPKTRRAATTAKRKAKKKPRR